MGAKNSDANSTPACAGINPTLCWYSDEIAICRAILGHFLLFQAEKHHMQVNSDVSYDFFFKLPALGVPITRLFRVSTSSGRPTSSPRALAKRACLIGSKPP